MRHDVDIEALCWPLASLAEGIEQLVRRAGLQPTAGEPLGAPDSSVAGSVKEISRWVAWIGERLGVEAEPVEVTAISAEALLVAGGPALLQLPGTGAPRFLLLLSSRFGKARLLCQDLRVRSCAVNLLRDALCAAHEASLVSELDRLLDVARVSPQRTASVRAALARERLGATRLGMGWILRLPPSASFWRQLREARVPGRLVAMIAIFAVTYALEILGWSIIGAAALNGRLDLGWLSAWMLLVMSIIPLRLVGGWFDAMLALNVSRLIKTRLLVGALQLDVEQVRHQGVGHLLSRVMESEAFESLALTFGLGSLVAVVELGFAAWVLSAGAGGALHLVLLLSWLLVSAALGARYFWRLKEWTRVRLDLTHDLVERMVGHRTTLAQELPERRDREQDGAMKGYLQASSSLDRSVTPFFAGVPSGWLLLGLGGLAPAFISGDATPASLAIGLGGVLLGHRAFSGLASGLSSAAGALVAWEQIGPLFRAASRPPLTAPFITSQQMQPPRLDGAPVRLIDADGLTFRYQGQDAPVLRSASLTIDHGDRLLIEGASGGGKSTLASLLVGLRTPDSGLLLLNGLDRFTLGDSWHQFATEAPQFHENHVLSGTMGFNLLMGRNWPASDDELKEAHDLCIELGLGDLLERMPSGLQQTVGETGWQLSHGERSRLFLARALLQDAPLTILDESFAALDPESLELCLSCVFQRARTLAVIAHP